MTFDLHGSVRLGTPLLRVIYHDSKHVHRHPLAKSTLDQCFLQVSLAFLFYLVRVYSSVGSRSVLNPTLSFVTIPDSFALGAGKRKPTAFQSFANCSSSYVVTAQQVPLSSDSRRARYHLLSNNIKPQTSHVVEGCSPNAVEWSGICSLSLAANERIRHDVAWSR